MVKKISTEEFAGEVASGVSVVDFSATWCGPCQMLAPILEEISKEMDGRMKFLSVDVDDNAALAAKYGISSIPALLVLEDGEAKDMQVGFRPKEDLVKFFEQYV